MAERQADLEGVAGLESPRRDRPRRLSRGVDRGVEVVVDGEDGLGQKGPASGEPDDCRRRLRAAGAAQPRAQQGEQAGRYAGARACDLQQGQQTLPSRRLVGGGPSSDDGAPTWAWRAASSRRRRRPVPGRAWSGSCRRGHRASGSGLGASIDPAGCDFAPSSRQQPEWTSPAGQPGIEARIRDPPDPRSPSARVELSLAEPPEHELLARLVGEQDEPGSEEQLGCHDSLLLAALVGPR